METRRQKFDEKVEIVILPSVEYLNATRNLISIYGRLAVLHRAGGPLLGLLIWGNLFMVFYQGTDTFMAAEVAFTLAGAAILVGAGALLGEKMRLINLEKQQRLYGELIAFEVVEQEVVEAEEIQEQS